MWVWHFLQEPHFGWFEREPKGPTEPFWGSPKARRTHVRPLFGWCLKEKPNTTTYLKGPHCEKQMWVCFSWEPIFGLFYSGSRDVLSGATFERARFQGGRVLGRCPREPQEELEARIGGWDFLGCKGISLLRGCSLWEALFVVSTQVMSHSPAFERSQHRCGYSLVIVSVP